MSSLLTLKQFIGASLNEMLSREICFAFESALQSGESPNIEAYLAGYTEPDLELLLLELIEIEQRQREASGEAGDLSSYLVRFPSYIEAIKSRFLTTEQPDADGSFGSTIGLIVPDTSEAVSLRLPMRTLGRYEFRQLVGQGAFGEVWRVYDPQLRREVALKTPREDVDASPGLRRQFVSEGRKAARLQHPGIVRVYDAGEDHGRSYIISELLRGGTLRERMIRGALEPTEALDLIIQIAEALDHAHRQGIVHRDIKPTNILVGADGRMQVSDFGLAKVANADASTNDRHEVLGTPAYMSPEQASGRAMEADARSDVFSLGVIMFEMLAGHRPFVGESCQELLKRLRRGEYEALRPTEGKLTAELVGVCQKAMALRPEDRHQTAAELAADLRRLTDAAPTVVTAAKRDAAGKWLKVGLTLTALLLVASMMIASRPDAAGSVSVQIETLPAAARVTFLPLDPSTGRIAPDGAVTASSGGLHRAQVEPGRYLVIAVLDDQRFHEVYRTVPAPNEQSAGSPYWHQFWLREGNERVSLPAIKIPPADIASGLTRFEGSNRFPIGVSGAKGVPSNWTGIPPFYALSKKVDRATWGKWSDLETLPSRFLARPAEERAAFDQGHAALNYISWDEAMHFAEMAGFRLLAEEEFEYAARQSPRNSPNEVPGGDWLSAPAEWTTSWATSLPVGNQGRVLVSNIGDRVVRGRTASPHQAAASPDLQNALHDRCFLDRRVSQPDVGFRLARSVKPRLHANDFVGATTIGTHPTP